MWGDQRIAGDVWDPGPPSSPDSGEIFCVSAMVDLHKKTWKKPSFNRKHRALNQNGFVFPIFSNVAPLLDKARCPQNQGVCPDVDELRFDAFW